VNCVLVSKLQVVSFFYLIKDSYQPVIIPSVIISLNQVQEVWYLTNFILNLQGQIRPSNESAIIYTVK